MSRALDGERKPALVLGASSDLAARLDLAAFGQVATERVALFIVNVFDLL